MMFPLLVRAAQILLVVMLRLLQESLLFLAWLPPPVLVLAAPLIPETMLMLFPLPIPMLFSLHVLILTMNRALVLVLMSYSGRSLRPGLSSRLAGRALLL